MADRANPPSGKAAANPPGETAGKPADEAPRGPHPLPVFLSLVHRLAGDDRARLRDILEGVRRYQQAPPAPPMPPLVPVAQRGDVVLRHVGGHIGGPADGAVNGGPALVIIPSLINAPAVLDLSPERSLVRFLAGRGFDTHMIDWGPMTGKDRRLGLAGLVSQRLLPLIASLNRPVRLVGYCVGGTLAIAAARLLGAQLQALALLAAPWHFDGFTDIARLRAVEVYRTARPLAELLGAFSITLVNPLFWSLDEQAVVEKFARLGRRPAGDPQISWFARVEDWANSGAPLTNAAARHLFLNLYGRNQTGKGQWRVRKTAIRPEEIAAPILDIGAASDRIVPAGARLRLPGIDRLTVPSGHVGMVVGSAAPAHLWEPLSNWLTNA